MCQAKMVVRIKDKNGQVIAEDVKVSERFKVYFEEGREAIVLAVGGGGKCPC